MLSDFINQREDPQLQLCSGVLVDVREQDEQMQNHVLQIKTKGEKECKIKGVTCYVLNIKCS